MGRRLDWATDGAGWPLREHSRFVEAAGLRWHVQQAPPEEMRDRHEPARPPEGRIPECAARRESSDPQGLPAETPHPGGQPAPSAAPAGRPRLLFVHGTGASTHSWAGLIAALGDSFDWLAVDLPGHAFTSMPPASRLGLPGMAAALADLLDALDWQPALAIGHSAGAALLVRMALDGRLQAGAIAAINGAFVPYGGLAAPLLSPLARLMYAAKGVPAMIARRAHDPAVVRRLIAGTGSTLDAEGLSRYGRLMRSPGHNEAALGMMAHWDLRALQRELPRLATPLHLLVADGDRAVPPRQARRLAAARPHTTLKSLHGLGHLAHEEAPAAVANWLRSLAITR
jgi:magnesium chelatase accessory protein